MSALVQVTGLYRYYAQHCAVENLNFSLNKGQVLGFLGVNGAGKTTTLQMLSGNLAPSAGNIKIKDFDLLKQPLQAKLALGYLPEIPPLYKDLTVDEFLSYCAKLHRISNTLQQQSINNSKEHCGLTQVGKRLIANLSKGYQQRIGIAQAILHNPDVIMLDEPMVGLDPIQIKEIRHLIKELAQEHGIILSSHILSEVQESCTHVQIIHQGKLILKKTVAELNLQIENSQLKLITGKKIEIEKIEILEEIIRVELLTDNQYLIHYKSNKNPIEALTEIIISNGWGLKEISPIKRSLEDIFLDLTTLPRLN